MASSSELKALGKAIAELRKSRGLTQKEVAGRVSTYYADERAYRRIESGERRPERRAAIAVLATGLEVVDVGRIDGVLAIAGYAPLTTAEASELNLTFTHPREVVAIPQLEPEHGLGLGFLRDERSRIWAVAILLGSAVLSCLLAALSGRTTFVIITALLYAALYAVSLLLECALDANQLRVWPVAASLFSLMFLSSVIALVVDSSLAGAGNSVALGASFGILLSAAAGQWVIARSVLSESAVVPLEFQSLTGQSAHLKNTVYHLVIVVFFWLPPFHCIEVLRREMRAGHAPWVRSLIERRVLLGRDLVAFSPEVLWFLSLFIALMTIPMGARLLENLKSHPRLNRYHGLLYLKAVLYFTLVLVCIIWYSSEIGALQVD